MNCLIVDDDLINIEIVNDLLKDYKHLFYNIYRASNAEDAIEIINDNKIDFLILDIQLPMMSGFDLLSNLDYELKVVTMSSNESYAFQSFEFNVDDFLLKPVTKKRLQKTIDKINFTEKKQTDEVIFIKEANDYIRIIKEDITFVKAKGDYIEIFLKNNKKMMCLFRFAHFLKLLDHDNLIRVHRSYAININQVDRISQDVIVIENEIIPISKTYKDSLFQNIIIIKQK